MIARIWGALARPGAAEVYCRHFNEVVLPALQGIEGFRGAYVLRRPGEPAGIQVISLWDSLDAVARFAGPDITLAVVEPAAQAVLSSYDRVVSHHEVAVAALR